MKQGTQFVLPVEIGMSLDEISRIEFVFKQKNYNGFPAIKLNGTSQGAWDGSSAKTIDITAASVGATNVTLRRW